MCSKLTNPILIEHRSHAAGVAACWADSFLSGLHHLHVISARTFCVGDGLAGNCRNNKTLTASKQLDISSFYAFRTMTHSLKVETADTSVRSSVMLC